MALEELNVIAQKVKDGQAVFGTARELISYFGYSRRGSWISRQICKQLDELGIMTFPPFDTTWIDEPFIYKLKDEPKPTEGTQEQKVEQSVGVTETDSVPEDPIFRVGRLKSANTEPLSVSPNATLSEAVTTMRMHDFSQLPVVNGNTLKGMVSWKSIGWYLSQKSKGTEVRHFMDKANEILSDKSLFKAIELVKQHDAVLVKNNKGEITGIITTYDLSAEFRQLAEPFLLLAEIEKQIRIILSDKLTVDELQAVKDPNDTGRNISCIDDLTFGEYVRIFQNPDLWDKLQLEIDQKVFSKQLDDIRRIRNDVMHFNPDPLENKDLLTLRRFSDFLDKLTEL